MNATDRTMQDDDLERQLRSWMGDQGPDADLTSTYDTIVDATRAAGQRPWFLVRRGIRQATPISDRRFFAERVAVPALLVLLAVLLAAGALVAGRRQQSDVQEPTPSPSSQAPTVFGDARALEDHVSLAPGPLYTSSRFRPTITFQTTARTLGLPEGDICLPVASSSRSLVFAHPKGCVEDLRVIRPWAVDCASAGEHPDADTLANAILAIPATSGSTDLGDLQTGNAVRPGMFAETYHGRVIEMLGYAPLFAGDLDDRDHCRLLPEPGSDDPVIEIRRDLSASFVLIDFNGELIVIRASTAGHDAPSGLDALSRGYANGDETQLRHLFGLITDIQFGP